MASLSIKYPTSVRQWEESSNSLVLVTVPDEDELLCVADDLRYDGCLYSLFNEPDIEEYTAIATLLPRSQWPRFKKLPLTLRDTNDSRWAREHLLRKEVQANG